jgi:hypothetical protein
VKGGECCGARRWLVSWISYLSQNTSISSRFFKELFDLIIFSKPALFFLDETWLMKKPSNFSMASSSKKLSHYIYEMAKD